MSRLSSRTRFRSLEAVFAKGRSPLLDSLAQLSVLYEDLRIETYALTASPDELNRLDVIGDKYRIHYFLRRSVATLLEFEGALTKLSRTPEYRSARTALPAKEVFIRVSDAVAYFSRNHAVLKKLRNAVGGHFHDQAAAFATRNPHPNAIAKLELTSHPSGRGGGPKLHYAGEIAATAFTRSLPGIKPREEEIKDMIIMIHAAYSHAARAMNALTIEFLWERF